MATIGATINVGAVGPSNIPVAAYSNAFVTGQTPWGEDSVVKICTSFSQWLQLFGGLNKMTTLAADGSADTWTTETTATVVNTYHSVKMYFEEKGAGSPGVLYFCRVVATAAGPTAALRTFTDGVGVTTVTSKWKGDPGETTTVTINNQTTYVIMVVTNAQAGITESWRIATAVDAANASKNSQLVTIALAASGSLPSTAASPLKLGNGTGATADPYTATTTNYVGTTTSAMARTGLQVFNDLRYGTGFVWAPGKGADATWRAGLKAHCNSYRRMGLVSADAGKTLSSVVSDQTTIAGSENCAYYWPQVYVPDASSQQGGIVIQGNEGAIAGLGARMDGKFNGPHKSPAGILYPFNSVIDLERSSSGQELVDDAGSNTCADATAYVNTLRVKNQSIVSWGLRTQAADERYRQINAVRVVQLVYHSCFFEVEKFTFEPIDPQGQLFARVKGTLSGLLKRLLRDGVLFGNEPGSEPKNTDAYQVVCDRSNNTPETMAAGILMVDVLIIPTLNAEQVRMSLAVATPGNARAAA